MATRPAAQPFFRQFVWYWLPVLVYITIIIVLSAQPGLKPPVNFINADKYYHVVEYGGLGVLLVRAMRVTARARWPLYASLMALSLGTAIGAADEIFQSFVPGRESSIFDVLADVSGLVLAQIVYLFVVRE